MAPNGTFATGEALILEHMLMDLSPVEWYSLLCYACFIIPFTVASNIFVVVAVFCHGPLRIEPNFYLASLAFTDLTMGTIVMPIAAYYHLVGTWKLGFIMCKVWTFFFFLCYTSSILHVCAIAIDRYCAITQPISYGSKRTVSQVRYLILVMWLVACLIVAPPYLGLMENESINDTFQQHSYCTLHKSFSFSVFYCVVMFVIPTTIVIFIYLRIFIITRRNIKLKLKRSLRMERIMDSEQQPRYEPSSIDSNEKEQPNGKIQGSLSRMDAKAPSIPQTNSVSLVPCPNCGIDDVAGSPALNGGGVGGTPTSTGFGTADSIVDDDEDEEDEEGGSVGSLMCSSAFECCSYCSICRAQRDEQSREQDGQGEDEAKEEKAADPPPAPPAAPLPTISAQAAPTPYEPSSLLPAAQKSRAAILQQKERRALLVTGVIIVTYLVCLTPPFGLYVALSHSPSLPVSPHLPLFFLWLAFSSSSFNPIIYAVFNRDFQDAFKKIVLRRQI